MALSPDQAAEVAQLLSDKPELTNNEIRQELGLPGSALFSIKSVRRQLGVPEPAAAPGSSPKPKRRRSSAKRGAKLGDVESETLDAGDAGAAPAEPSGPQRTAWRPKSLLAPVLPRIAQSLVVGITAGTYDLTKGRAPMTRQEATAIAVPLMRITDRTAAKYIKRTGKVTENQEDVALLAITLVTWFAGWMIALWQGRKAQARPAAAPVDVTDLYGGSEPSAPAVATVPLSPAASAAFGPQAAPVVRSAPAHAAMDDGDLFAGSEPLAAGAGAEPSMPAPISGPGRSGVSEATWQAIMPTDMGEALAAG